MTSRFVALSDYCVLEFMLTPLGDPAPQILNTSFFLIKNQNVDAYQVFNTDSYTTVTRNTRDLSVIPIGGSRLIKDSIDKVPIYSEYDASITQSVVDPTLSSFLIMDTMRFHFASGFNFTEVSNIVLGARQKMNNLSQVQLASVLITAETASSLLIFNNKPLYLANTVYDKYVDIKIPSLAHIDQDFIQFGSTSFEAAITNNVGFIKDSPITVSLTEANYEEYNAPNGEKYEMYRVVNYFEGSVPQVNQFEGLGSVIQEAPDGDYLQFFATWNNAFPDGLIASLNELGANNDWLLIHQLQVYEQIGSSFVPSGNLTIYQEDAFDSPMSYRPILKEAGSAVSMSIDHTVRLLNRATGDQVIRTGSLSIWNPNKYGKHLLKIELADLPQSLKVYNKIVQKSIETSNLFTGIKLPQAAASASQIVTQIKEVKVGVPTFHKQANIRLSQKNALLKSTDGSSELIFGQGELVVPIDPTDNFIRLNVYEADSADPSKQLAANLNTNSTFTLNFGKNSTLTYNSLTDPAYENPSTGQIAFRIPKEQSKKILELTDQLMYICLIAEDGSETLMYSGQWMPSSEYATVLKAADAAKTALLNDPQATISSLTDKISQLEKTNAELIAKLNSQKVGGVISNSTGQFEIRKETFQNINVISSQQAATEVSVTVNNGVVPAKTIQSDYTAETTRRAYSGSPIQTVDTLSGTL
jgi:hypothetical protein